MVIWLLSPLFEMLLARGQIIQRSNSSAVFRTLARLKAFKKASLEEKPGKTIIESRTIYE
jgi:hypothetical protein